MRRRFSRRRAHSKGHRKSRRSGRRTTRRKQSGGVVQWFKNMFQSPMKTPQAIGKYRSPGNLQKGVELVSKSNISPVSNRSSLYSMSNVPNPTTPNPSSRFSLSRRVASPRNSYTPSSIRPGTKDRSPGNKPPRRLTFASNSSPKNP